jgi:hypothetical protein
MYGECGSFNFSEMLKSVRVTFGVVLMIWGILCLMPGLGTQLAGVAMVIVAGIMIFKK